MEKMGSTKYEIRKYIDDISYEGFCLPHIHLHCPITLVFLISSSYGFSAESPLVKSVQLLLEPEGLRRALR